MRTFVTLVAFAMVAGGCGSSDGSSPAGTVPITVTTNTVEPGSTITAPPTTKTPEACTSSDQSGSVTVFDLPEVQEVGMWWLVPQSDAVVYGRLLDLAETPMWGDTRYQIWNVEVTESILGTLEDGEVIRLFRRDPCEPPMTTSRRSKLFESGREGIFFLRRAEVGGTGVGPSDLFTPRIGDSAVLFDNTNAALAKLRAVSGGEGDIALGSGLPQGSDHYHGTDFAVAGVVGKRVSSGDIFGWDYVEFQLKDVKSVWSWQGFPEEGVPPLVLPDEFVIRVGADVAAELEQAEPRIFLLERADPLGSGRVVFMPSGGTAVGIVPIGSSDEVIALLDDAHDLDKSEQARLARAHAALDNARLLVTLAGELPFP